MDKIKPIIINAKPAQRHLDMVRGQHTSILNDMQNHALKVQMYNQNKLIEKQNQQMKDDELQKEFRTTQATQQKESADRDLKLKEVELKRMALTQPNEI